jgi:ubiquitin C-terminal hydrolase
MYNLKLSEWNKSCQYAIEQAKLLTENDNIQTKMKVCSNYIDEKFKLSGVIEHFGTAHGGHYVAYRPLFNHKLD